MSRVVLIVLLGVILPISTAGFTGAQEEEQTKTAPEAKSAEEEAAPIVTEHQIRLNGEVLSYRVTAGKMPIRKDSIRRRSR